MALFTAVPQNHVLTSGVNSALTWTNALSVSSISASTLNASNLTVSTLATSSSVTTSTLTTGRLNYSSIVGSSISTNAMTLSLTAVSTQNTQIYQVATTDPTTSYTAIQASHVGTGTANNALVLNPSGGNVGVGTTAPPSLFSVGSTSNNVYFFNPLSTNTITLFGAAQGSPTIAGNSTLNGTLFVNSTTPYARNVGASIALGGLGNDFGAGNQHMTFAKISGVQTTDVDNFEGDFVVETHVSGTMKERLRIKPNGNVGIGTTTPGATLHVVGTGIGNSYSDTFILNIGASDSVNGDGGNTVYSRSINLHSGDLAWVGNRAHGAQIYIGGGFSINSAVNHGPIILTTANTERMRIAGNGNVGIGTTNPAARLDVAGSSVTNSEVFRCFLSNNGNQILSVFATANTTNGGWNGSDTVLRVTRDTGTNRSINTAGTINASGADYAEYMTKDSDFPALKGDLLGVLPSGKLTNQFDTAIHFLLKSTNPCMVGGDVWGTEEIVGEKPKNLAKDATEEEKEAHAAALADWESRLEAERQKVDRMAFAGQVPVNIQGTTPGDYIIPARNADGTIGVAAVSKMDVTFAQYQSAVGRVISILADGRANVIVKAV